MPESYEKQFASSFDWRRGRQIENLLDITELPGAKPEPLHPKFLHSFGMSVEGDEVENALRRSLIYLVPEAIHTYVLGYFQASILVSGAVLERTLKLEYRCTHGALPDGHWTLGKCVYKLNWEETHINKAHLEHIKQFIGTRNSRTHAILEHENPFSAIVGGKRGVEVLSNGHYLIEPFRGEAKTGITALFTILSDLYDD